MDMGKVFTALGAFLLAVCLVLSITTLTVLRNAIDEGRQIQREAEALMDVLSGSVDKLEDSVEVIKPVEDTPVDTPAEEPIFILRTVNGKPGIFNEEGQMLHWIDLSVELLPTSDRALLEQGLRIEGIQKLLQTIEDLQG